MADDQALDQRLAQMRGRRVEALRTQARREAALDILDTDGAVSTDAVDTRVAATFTPPTDASLDNLMAQEAAASVDHEAGQVTAANEAVVRADERVENFRLVLASAEEAAANAREEVATVQGRYAAAVDRAEHAARLGDASAAPAPITVTAAADTASAAGSL